MKRVFLKKTTLDIFKSQIFYTNIITLLMHQQIRLSRFKYAHCQGGGLHQGEILNLVCIDDKCIHRGLVCPVCKMETHNDHYILPIKHFLSQINQLVADSQTSDELTNLGDYLRTIEAIKKDLLKIVKEQINQLANLFKEIQVNIQETYLSLRRNVLIQSSSCTKLPKLIALLTNQQKKDAFQLQNQFRKYCEMIKYKDEKPKITDKASILVNSYKNTLHNFGNSAKAALIQYKKKMLATINSLQNAQNDLPVELKNDGFLFSTEDKNIDIQVNEQKNQAQQAQFGQKAFIAVNKPFTSQQNSLTFKIIKNQSYMILVGFGDISRLRENSFLNKEESYCMQMFVISDGTTNLNYNQESVDTCFEMLEGDTITVRVDKDTHLWQVSKGNLKFKLPLKSNVLDDDNIRLCFGMSGGDKIRIQN